MRDPTIFDRIEARLAALESRPDLEAPLEQLEARTQLLERALPEDHLITNPLAVGAGGALEGEFAVLANIERQLLGTANPSALVEHTAATFELEPSATKAALVYWTVQSKTVTEAQYAVLVGGVQVSTVFIPKSITESLIFTITVYVPAGKKFKAEKLAATTLEKSFTSIQLMN